MDTKEDIFKNLTTIDKIKRITRNTVEKLVKKMLYKPTLVKTEKGYATDYRYMDMRKLKSYQYQKYIIPYDVEDNRYIVLDKKEYYRILFRLFATFVHRISIHSVVHNMYKDRMEMLTTLNRNTYNKINDSIYNKFDIYVHEYDKLDKFDVNERFGIIIPNVNSEIIFNEFKTHMISKKILNEKKINNLIKNMKRTLHSFIIKDEPDEDEPDEDETDEDEPQSKYDEKDYTSTFYYYEIVNNDIDKNALNIYMIISLITFMIIKSPDNLFVVGMTKKKTRKNEDNEITTQSHQNELIIQKIYDHDKLKKIMFHNYEPHGYVNMLLDENIFDNFVKYTDKFLDQDNELVQFEYHLKTATCPFGPQFYSKTEDVGYCEIISFFWYLCFLNVLENIKLYDNYITLNNIKDVQLLSTIPLSDWIIFVDESITAMYYMLSVQYPKDKYSTDKVITTMKYFIDNDFTDNEEYIKLFLYDNINKFKDIINININNFREIEKKLISDKQHLLENSFSISKKIYFIIIQHIILDIAKSENINKITFEEFFILYEKALFRIGVDEKTIKTIIEKKNKLRNAGYFNIFVEFAYYIFEYMHRTEYLKEQDKKIINEIFKSDEILLNQLFKLFYMKIETIKDIRNPNYLSANIDEDELKRQRYTTDIESVVDESVLSKRITKENETSIEFILGDGDLKKGETEFRTVLSEKDEEINNKEKPYYPPFKICKTDTDCTELGENTECNTEENICVNKKLQIGEECKENRDCFSDNCRLYKYQTSEGNKEYRICRK